MRIARGPIQAVLFPALLAITLACDETRPPDSIASDAAPAPRTQVLNLARAFPRAVARVETRSIDFGRPEARPHLREGWSRDERGEDGSTWVGAVGGHSTLVLFCAGDEPRAVALRIRPVPSSRGRPEWMRVAVNGSDVAELELKPGWATVRVPLFRGVLRPGDNDFAFDFTDPEDPGNLDAQASGSPHPSIRFQSLRLLGGPAAAAPRARGLDLELPNGARLEYFLRLAPGAALRIAGIETLDGKSAGSLLVEVDGDAARLAAARWNAGETPPPLAIPLEEADYVRTALHALGAGVRLKSAEISGNIVAPAELPAEPERSRSGAPPNVIVYLVDTLRADHLGAYGYAKPVSPAIDSLAARGVTFLQARANSSWTRPSAATVLTGLLPRTHSAVGRRDAIPEAVTTLAERLQQHGYATAGFVTNGNTAAEFGFAQGFDAYERMPEKVARPGIHVGSGRLHRKVLRWLDRRESDEPFFLYIHASDPHAPYTPPAEEIRELAPRAPDLRVGSLAFLKQLESPGIEVQESLRDDIIALYDAEIAAFDENFGRFLAALEERGALDDTFVIFTSDHGEEFSEHGGWQHGRSVYGEQLRVPLIVRFPDGSRAGERSAVPVDHIDIVPTILNHAGLAADPALPGRSLAERIRQGAIPGRPLYSALNVDGLNMESLELDGLKLVEYGSYRPREVNPRLVELFDLNRDPGEKEDLARSRPATTGFLRQRLRAYREGIAAPSGSARASVDPETEEALRALGYAE